MTYPVTRIELACGSIKNRQEFLGSRDNLASAQVADTREVLALIGSAKLMSHGVGFADAHLLAAVLITPTARIWTRSKRLAAPPERLGVAWASTVCSRTAR